MAVSDVNPNPRGWRHNNFFVDLEHVVAVTLRNDDVVNIMFDNVQHTASDVWTPVFRISNNLSEVLKSLLDALEIYRSNR